MESPAFCLILPLTDLSARETTVKTQLVNQWTYESIVEEAFLHKTIRYHVVFMKYEIRNDCEDGTYVIL